MNKLKSIIQYECMTSFKYIWIFYAIQYAIVGLITLIIGIVSGSFENVGTNCLEINTLFFVSILGALGFKEDFKTLIQNGFTRKYIFIAALSLFSFMSGIMAFIDTVVGNFRSVPMERLIKEAKELAEQGVKELILVAQETTLYGKDLYGEKCLHRLVEELCKIAGIRWIRILYCYPEEITDELIEVIKKEPKVCHYLDLPIQHASDSILKRMGRRTSKQELTDIVKKLRKEIPDICLRTTLITGFPGETEDQHEELMQFVDEMEFDRLGVFTYSPEEDTPAAVMPDQIAEEVKEERQADLMELQQEIAFDNAENMIGREMLVMIEGKVADENAYVGRTYRDAPNVDGLIFINTEEELISGDFAKVKITGALEYDLIGELL